MYACISPSIDRHSDNTDESNLIYFSLRGESDLKRLSRCFEFC